METTSINGITYNIEHLRPFVESVIPVQVELNAFQESILPQHKYWLDAYDQPIGPSDFLRNWEQAQQQPNLQHHVESIRRSDLSNPIWVFKPTNQVIDGMHRVTKAFLKDEPTILVRYLDSLPPFNSN